MFAGWWASFLILLLFLSGCTVPMHEVTEATDTVRIQIVGGTAEYDPRLQPGARFLKAVPAATFDHQEDPETEAPGDGYDDGLVIMQRRSTSRGHENDPLTGGLLLEGVHGTADSPICVCDATFVMWNVTEGYHPLPAIRIKHSSHVLIDNVTIHKVGIGLIESANITITRSLFMDGGGISTRDTWDMVIRDNSFIDQRGPLNAYNHPPVESECWPREAPCEATGISIAAGGRALINYNHFDGDGGIGGTGDNRDIRIVHNTLYNGGAMLVGDGKTEVGWNLVRGWGNGGAHVAGSAYSHVHNNSFVLHSALDLRDRVFSQWHGAFIRACAECLVENNDFIGYGIGAQAEVMQQALHAYDSEVWANDNYWGTVHDPRLPPDTWIELREGAILHLDRWETEPIHPVSVGLFLNPQDTPYNYEKITGTRWPID